MDTRWVRTWKSDESRASGRRAKARLIIKGFTDPDLLNIESHSSALTRERFMTVLQSVCSHGHKLQFGNVQQAFNTGDPIKRKEPLFVRMPPEGVPGEPSGVLVQLLKTVNGLADGTREWRNSFLATARGLGFEKSVLEPCVLVMRSTQQKIPWHRSGGRRRYCWWRRRSLGASNLQVEATFHFRTLRSGRGRILET